MRSLPDQKPQERNSKATLNENNERKRNKVVELSRHSIRDKTLVFSNESWSIRAKYLQHVSYQIKTSITPVMTLCCNRSDRLHGIRRCMDTELVQIADARMMTALVENNAYYF